MKAKFTFNGKNWLRRILGTAGIVAALCLASCSNLIEEEKINVVKDVNQDNDVKPDKEGYVKLRIAVSESSFRATYRPEVSSPDAFTSFSLLCDGTQLGFWQTGDGLNAYDVMRSEPVRVKTGSYNFELIADKDGVKYSGTKSAVITGSDTIEFALKFTGITTGTNGNERINVTFPSSASKLVIERYKYEDVTSLIISDAEPVVTTATSFSVNGNGLKYNPNVANYAAGKYKYVFTFYASGITEPVLSIRHIVYISGGSTTYVAFDITEFTDVYDINYFNTNGVSYTGDVPLAYAGGTAVTLPVPKKEHYVFGGWYEDEDFSGTAVTGWAAGAKSGNVTLYAKWTPETYTVSFYSALNADGSYGTTAFATQSVSYNEYAQAPLTTPERTGYTFERWVTDGSSTAFSFETTAITKDTKLYALWKNSGNNKVSYPVYFYYDDTTVYAVQNVAEGETASAPATAPAREEFAFRGWYTEANKNSKNPAQSYNFSTSVTSSLKLYASWCRTTYHVSESGSDTSSYDGSEARPYATLTKAISMIEADSYAGGADYSSFTGNVDFTLVIHGNVVQPKKNNISYIYMINDAGDSSGSQCYRLQGVKSLTVRGATGAAEDSISGADGAYLGIYTDVPVTFADISEHFNLLYIGNGNVTATATFDSGTEAKATEVYNGSLVMNGGIAVMGISLRKSVYGKACSFTMNDGIITGGIYNDLGTVEMNGGIITGGSGKSATQEDGSYLCAGGGVFNTGLFTMNGGEITNNTVYTYQTSYGTTYTYACGGGVYNKGSFELRNGKITGNTVSIKFYKSYGNNINPYLYAYGGGVYNEGNFYIYGGEISDNKVKTDAYANVTSNGPTGSIKSYTCGGGVYTKSYLYMSGGTISGNTLDSTVISGKSIYNSKDYKEGEGIYVDGESGSLYFGSSALVPFDFVPQTIFVGGENRIVYLMYCSSGITERAAFEFETPSSRKVFYDATNSTGAVSSLYSKIRIANEGWTVNSNGYLSPLNSGTEYTITYLDQGGAEFSGVHDPGYPTKYYSGSTTTLDTPTKPHYTFGGWYISSDGGQSLVTQKSTLSGANGDIILYAKWTPKNSYSIYYYDAYSAAYSGTNEADLPSKKYQGETEKLVDGVKPGFTFGGWYTTSACTGSPVTSLTANTTATLYAKWIRESWLINWVSSVEGFTWKEPVNGYTRYASDLPTLRTTGSTIEVPSISKTNYVFEGWYLNPEFTGAKVTSLTDDKTPGDVTLYAKWKPHYSITYKDFGGEDFSGTTSATRPSYRNAGETRILPNATKEGYVFMGWYTASNTLIAKLDDTTCTSDMTLYAKWKEGSESVNITIDQGDVTITQTEEDGVVTLTAAGGFTNYTWTVFDNAPSEFAGFALSVDGKTLTVTKAELLEGFGYEVKVLAYKNGMPYQTFTTVTK